jgi:uncharacterized membrane protein
MNWITILNTSWKRNTGIIMLFISMGLKAFNINMPNGFENDLTQFLDTIGTILTGIGVIHDLAKKMWPTIINLFTKQKETK